MEDVVAAPQTSRTHILVRALGYAYRWGLDLLFPPSCVVCERVGVWLCDECASQIQPLQTRVCTRCGRPWNGGSICRECETNPPLVQRSRAVFLYKEPIRGAIHALKYRGGRQVAAALGQTMAASWLGYAMEADLLAPVPLYPGREARRGYNQATLLARELGKHLGIPMAPHVLYRVRNTLSQTKLSREQRRTNVVNAFVCAEGLDLTGCRVVLIDDVMTTGATLQACAGVLLNVGAEAVNAFTLARAP